jgi:hypothetical protein
MNQRYYSNVYWHFTGSPTNLDGQLVTRPSDIHQVGILKSLDEATDTLLTILRMKRLLATSREAISENIQTDLFCCVTDIPLKDLPLHAVNYGRVALGFKASAIQDRFVPVLYLSKNNLLMKEKLIPDRVHTHRAYQQFYANERWAQTQGYRIQRNNGDVIEEESAIDPVLQENPFLNFIKITDFGIEPDETFYSEREWRCIGDYNFQAEDIEAVIAPAEKLPYLRKCLFDELGYPEDLTLFSWEFLENA